jgi:UbiD family decarboxylase
VQDALREGLKEWHKTWPEYPPEVVESGSVLENIIPRDEADLYAFPVPKWCQEDGGRFIGTGDAVITRDPDTGEVNIGTYRTMIQDQSSATFYIMPGKHGRFQYEKYHSRGEPCPVAISLGHDPLMFMVSCINLPPGSEYHFAGAMRKRPLRVIKEEITGLPIPADAEIVIAGWSYPQEKKMEGPFGEWQGYYATHERLAPVIEIERIYHRNNPIILGMPNHRGRSEDSYWSALMGSSIVQTDAERVGLPGIKRIWFNVGMGQMFVVASIKQMYAGHDKDVAMFINSRRAATPLARFVIVVDDDIDPSNIQEVIWAMCTRCDPDKHIDIIRRTRTGANDPIVQPGTVKGTGFLGSRAIISACKPFEWIEDFPEDIKMSPELVGKVKESWGKIMKL